MNENKEFKPYIPADKITPEFTVTSIIMGVILAVIFGAANGRDPRPAQEELHSGEQHGPDNRFSR